MITKMNKVIEISIDTNQERYNGYIIETLTDFLTSIFKLLGVEVFINTYNEKYED